MSYLSLPHVDGLTPKLAAIAYAQAGWPVFPCEASNYDARKDSWAKRPHSMLREEEAARGEGGWKLATTNIDKVEEWWTRDPEALIGLPPGMAGAVVLDGDGREGIKALYEEARGNLDLASTATSKTPGKGGGLHVWFDRRSRNGVIGNGSLRRVPGEARGDRGYVIVPPSRLPDGKRYEFVGHTYDLAEIPDWAADLLPWEVEGSVRASIADITKGDEHEWLLARSAPTTDAEARRAIDQAVREIRNAVPQDVEQGRHPTAVRHVASILSRAQRREIAVDLIDAIAEIRSALLSVKPKGGGDFDRFVSDAVALRAAEDRARAASTVDWTKLPLAEEAETWADPDELGEMFTDNRFPIEELPDLMRRTVEEVAKATQVSETLPAMAALGCVSAACANGVKIVLNPSWDEGLSLWLIGVADPSERKTSVLSPFERSIRWACSQWATRTEKDRAEWEAKKRQLEAQLKDAEKVIATPEGKVEFERLTLVYDGHMRDRKVVPDFIHSDPTQEALIVSMAEQNGMAFLSSTEGSFIANLAGKYSQGGESNDLSNVNNAYSRAHIRSTRVTRKAAVVPVPQLTMTMFIQPKVAELLRHPDFEASGFLSRALIARPKSLVGNRATTLSGHSPLYVIVMQKWQERMLDIFQRFWGRTDDPVVLAMEPSAVPLFEEFWAKAERLSPKEPWWGKAHGHAARIAAVLTLVEEPSAIYVTRESVRVAIQIVEFFAQERKRERESLATFVGGERVDRVVRAVVKRWEEIDHTRGFTLREIGRWSRIFKAQDVMIPCEELVNAGWLRDPGDQGRYIPHPDFKTWAEALGENRVTERDSRVTARDNRVTARDKVSSPLTASSTTSSTESTVVTPVTRLSRESVTAKTPVSIEDSGDCHAVTGGEGGVSVDPHLEATDPLYMPVFKSSSSSSNVLSTGEDSRRVPMHPSTDTPRDTRDSVTDTSKTLMEPGDSGDSEARDKRVTARDSVTTGSTGGLVETLDRAVDEVLDEPDVKASLRSFMGERPADHFDNDEEAGNAPVEMGVPRCPECGSMMLTLADASRRCMKCGEDR